MKYKIEKNIPIPEKQTNQCEYPFSDMEIGDSFLCKNNDKARLFAKKFGYKVKTKQAKEGYRVWKIA
jgi:hypothetical protein